MFITKFLLWVFNTIVGQRNRALRAALERDPEYKAIKARLEQGRKELEDWSDKQAQGDPKAQETLEMVRNLKALGEPRSPK